MRKKISPLYNLRKHLFILSLQCLCVTLNAQSNIDIIHYKFELSLNDKNDTVYGCATIRLRFLQADTSFSVDLTAQDRKGKGMKTDKVTSATNEIKNYFAGNDQLKIFLAKPARENDTLTVSIYYHGVPEDGLIISKNKYGLRTFFADNWPDRAHNTLC